jgi:hypothetical protein
MDSSAHTAPIDSETVKENASRADAWIRHRNYIDLSALTGPLDLEVINVC